MTTTGVRLLLLAVLATTVAAADDAEFAFNLLTDVAPILALFGDAFAKQFMSESLTWVDHLIFAVVPLGIITAITAAIRVQGMQVAKAFVGRARENRALAEIELMSSTSGEVCELFNGNSIVRAMGKPRIEQFLIFPNEYDALEEKYKQSDDAGEEPEDKSCGIHSLRTAASREPGESKLMVCKPYSSDSVTVIQECSESALAFFRRLCWHPLRTITELFRSASPTPPGDEKGAETTSTESGHPPLPPGAEPALRGPPNLQLNLSSDHFDQNTLKKRHELILAAVVAVLLQTGLIVIAAATAYHLNPGSSSFFEIKVYGFPCYAAGSLLLSIGTGLCSFIVEHSTIEHSWEAVNSSGEKMNGEKAKPQKNAPRLVWIQRYQTVNDQSFKGYIILAGPKRRVITSRRDDDIEKHHRSDDSASGGPHSSRGGKNEGFWQWLTVGAALSAGLGFIAQFMGLRGLAFPCSIAQLGAIFIMALIRASIRRRLGRVPAHCPALEGYELDFLATQLVFYPKVRTSDQCGKGEENYGGDKLPSDFCRWKIKTADPKQRNAFFAQPTLTSRSDPKDGTTISEPAQQHSSITSQKSRTGPDFKASSSQQLIRVRERLGDLCHFTSKSTESALSLAQSIELFMNSFSPLSTGEDESEEPLSHVDWLIEATTLTSTGVSEDPDKVKIPVVRRNSDGKWEVDVAKIDAAISLWMASIEAKKAKDAKNAQQRRDARQGLGNGRSATDVARHSGDTLPEWRRTKVGDDLRRSFGRIIGDNLNDEVLKRDISWWVDSIIAEQSDPAVEDENNSIDEGNENSSDAEGNGRLWSRARGSGVDLVIGFNGNKPHTDPARELGITSNGYLHTNLAQHFFTSFMWTVVEFLPKNCLNPGIDEIQQEVEIEGPKVFESYDFTQTWLRPKLRHRRLTKVVREMESYGLGSTTDMLLCMIPALSSRSLLPNQAIFKLMPRVGSGRGWVEIANCHKKLLETIKTDEVSEEDQFSVAIVVASMDFLSFAYEPYDEQTKPPPDLDNELKTIVEKLLSPKFITVLEKLAPVYRRQCRHRLLYNVLQYPAGPVRGLDEDFAKNILGFAQSHLRTFFRTDELMLNRRATAREFRTYEKHDIFGWTPYHYQVVDDIDRADFELFLEDSKGRAERLPSMLDNLGRSPIQIAVLVGRRDIFEAIFRHLSKEGCKKAVQASGTDDMTLLHLIAKSGSLDCLDSISPPETKALLSKKDIWGRQALHIASKLGHGEIISELLEMGSRSDELDDAGRCPVYYFVQRWKEKGPESTVQEQHSNNPEANDSPGNEFSKNLSKESFELFLKFAMEPHCRYSNGKTFLHFAVEVAGDDNIRTLVCEKGFDVEARDNDGRTPLHCAILSGRPSVVSTLIKDFRAKPSAKDSRNTTALMFAVQKNYIDVARAILDVSDPSSVNEVDDDKKAAIHYVRSREMADFLITNKCNLLATDSRGRSALHTAIERKDNVALYLLGLEDPRQVQTEPFDDNKESLLVTACRCGFSEIVPGILGLWPNIINNEDEKEGLPPISWACVGGHSDVVAKLLQHEGSERVNVNKTAWAIKYTPLHFAATLGDSKCLALLLEQSSTKIHQQGGVGETRPLRLAVRFGRKDAARMLLQDHRTAPKEQLRHIKEFTSSSSSVFQSIIGDILETFAGTSLIRDYFEWLVDITAAPGAQESINKFVVDIKRGGWKKLKTPYHLAIFLGDAEFMQILKEQDVPQGGLDEDNWSLVDYAKRFDRDGTLTSLVNHFQPLDASMEHKHKEPTTLICTSSEPIVKVTSCATKGHDYCSKVHDVKVIWLSMGSWHTCIRSDHSIPPSNKYFYFEVEVLQDSVSQIFGIGFCRLNDSDDQMPGWFKGSWGYHGDNGKLFIESRTGATPSSDFADSGKLKSGDVVGVCLNVNTGQGFCTRNGKKLNMGNAFEGHEERFKYGSKNMQHQSPML
ncbi:Protein SSH4 [Fusarium keratoplasticum]|nr:Protein SSH4 [Fusarium keratoplasticum]